MRLEKSSINPPIILRFEPKAYIQIDFSVICDNFYKKKVVVAVAKSIWIAERNALHSKKIVLSLQIYIFMQMFTSICSSPAIRFTSKNLEE